MKCAICGYDDLGTGDSAHSCRAAPIAAQLDAEELPPLPEGCAASKFGPHTIVYTAEQVRQAQREAVAADRRKQAALQALVDQAQELDMGYGPGAQQRAQSIDTPEFRALLGKYSETLVKGYVHREADEEAFIAARRELIAYIDGRTAGTAGEAAPEEWREVIDKAAWMLDTYEKHLYQLEPIDIEAHPYIPSIGETANELRAMLPAAPTPQSPAGGEEQAK